MRRLVSIISRIVRNIPRKMENYKMSTRIGPEMNPEIEIILSKTACMAYEPGYKEYTDFPFTDEPVWILGKKYSILHDLEEIRLHICSKLWFTYRKGFSPIGGTGPTSDTGWGCMLRCGQMVMAQALLYHHLGRDWIWNPKSHDAVYACILQMFQDKKDCTYSIHQIAQMGVSEGKNIGQWFGPNTIAQVLKKLAIYDDWSKIIVHVALDNAVIIDDLKMICKGKVKDDHNSKKQSSENIGSSRQVSSQRSSTRNRTGAWKPLVLFIPLRLGLAEINPVYIRSLKITFCLKQSLGIIGGKPNHALYFIGAVGNEVVYLDPHLTNPVVDLAGENLEDSSYHCAYGSSKRMNLTQMDPSVALCFYFQNEEELESWCNQVHKFIISSESQPLFEVSKERPPHWPPLELPEDNYMGSSFEFTFVDQDIPSDTSEEEFEIL